MSCHGKSLQQKEKLTDLIFFLSALEKGTLATIKIPHYTDYITGELKSINACTDEV